MNEKPESANLLRQVLSVFSGVACVAAGVWLCYWMIILGGILGGMGVSVLPVVVGLVAGLAMRYSCAQGSFGLASAGVVLILVFGLACSTMRHKLWFDARLKQDVATTYDETLAYAQHIVPVELDNKALRRFMTNNEVSVIGRITPIENGNQHYGYWETRNFIHLHWVATRQVVLLGQTGVDKTIAEATRVLGDDIFLDNIVSSISKNDSVTDDDLWRFQQHELPFLTQMTEGKIAAKDFERPLIKEVNSHVDWATFATNGFEPFLGMAMLLGSLIIYKLVRQPSEMEMV